MAWQLCQLLGNLYINNKSTQRAQTSADAKILTDSDPGCQSNFRINPDPDVCRICPAMLWMHYLVSVSHFAKYGTNRPLIVREMLTNLMSKNPLFRNGEDLKQWSGIHMLIRITTKS